MSVANISWGPGVVDTGKTNATLDTEDTAYVVDGNWSASGVDGFLIQNTGNIDLNITVQSDLPWNNYTAATFIGGSGPLYRYSVNEIDAGSCSDEESEQTIDFDSERDHQLCGNLTWRDGESIITVDVNISVPSDSLTGYMNDSWIFTGAQRT